MRRRGTTDRLGIKLWENSVFAHLKAPITGEKKKSQSLALFKHPSLLLLLTLSFPKHGHPSQPARHAAPTSLPIAPISTQHRGKMLVHPACWLLVKTLFMESLHEAASKNVFCKWWEFQSGFKGLSKTLKSERFSVLFSISVTKVGNNEVILWRVYHAVLEWFLEVSDRNNLTIFAPDY